MIFQEGVKLNLHSNYKIGGLARYFFEAKNIEEIIKAVEEAHRIKIPIFILAGGTNILFGDEGFEGLILKPDIQFIKKENNLVRVGAGISITQLLDYLITNGLSGLEWAAGLPGSLGGAIRGNAGCFGGETQMIIKEIVSLDISGPQIKIIRRSKDDCDFGYRSSIFKRQPFGKLRASEIIIEAALIFKKGDKKSMQAISDENINYRKQRQPLEYPNIGSIFKNVNLEEVVENQRKNFESVIKTDPFPVVPAAHLISEAGLRGISYGGAMISPKHPNFIVNILNASANDVKNLIQLAKKEVKKKFGLNLEEEIEQLS